MQRIARLLLLIFVLLSPSLASAQLSLESEAVRLDFNGRIQAGYNYRFLAEGDEDHDANRFFIDQARLGFEFEAFGLATGEISFDLIGNEGRPEAKDISISTASETWLDVKIGQFKASLSRERVSSGRTLLFIDRLDPSKNFIPSRDVGVQFDFHSPERRLNAQLGTFNGRGANQFKEDELGMPMVTARLATMPWGIVAKGQGDVERSHVFGIELGIFGAYSEDSEPPEDLAGDPNPRLAIQGKKALYGADFTIKYLGLFVSGEFAGAYYEPDEGESYFAAGFMAQASYFIAQIGLEPALRFNYFNPSDLDDQALERTITLGFNFYPTANHNFKSMLNYSYHFENSETGQSWDEDELTLFMQLAF